MNEENIPKIKEVYNEMSDMLKERCRRGDVTVTEIIGLMQRLSFDIQYSIHRAEEKESDSE